MAELSSFSQTRNRRPSMNPLLWYPPAESRIRLKCFAHALLTNHENLADRLCSFFGAQSCVLGGSGRALMTLLLQTLKHADTKNRDQVLVPAYTCYSVAASVAKAGLKIAVYDLDPHTLAPDETSLNRVAGSAALAIVHQHLFGIPQPVEPIREAADRLGIPIIEDAAQGLGGFLNNTPMGSMGDYGIFSFGRGKPLAAGSGGALTGGSRTLEAIQLPGRKPGYVPMGMSMAVQVLSHPLFYGIMEMLPLGLGKTIFDPGFAITGMPRAVKKLAEVLLADIDPCSDWRRCIAGVYRSCLQHSRMVPEPEGAQPAYPRFPFFSGPGMVGRRLLRLGVRRMYPRAIIDEPAIARFIANPDSPAPGARQIARDLVTLPTHSRITPSRARQISALIMDECGAGSGIFSGRSNPTHCLPS